MHYDFEQGSNEIKFMGYYGAGINYALGELTDLRLDVRHLVYYSDNDRTESPESGGRFQNHLQAMVGLTYQFGAPPVAALQEKLPNRSSWKNPKVRLTATLTLFFILRTNARERPPGSRSITMAVPRSKWRSSRCI